jgi:hypothetical protein
MDTRKQNHIGRGPDKARKVQINSCTARKAPVARTSKCGNVCKAYRSLTKQLRHLHKQSDCCFIRDLLTHLERSAPQCDTVNREAMTLYRRAAGHEDKESRIAALDEVLDVAEGLMADGLVPLLYTKEEWDHLITQCRLLASYMDAAEELLEGVRYA